MSDVLRSMPVSPPEAHKPAHLAALYRMGVADAVATESFDRLTRLASRILRAPFALVSLTSSGDQLLQSCVGLAGVQALGIEDTVLNLCCTEVVASGVRLVVDDMDGCEVPGAGPRRDTIGIGSFLGVPILSVDGSAIGSLCVADVVSRRWTAEQVELLEDLGGSVLSEVELRKAVRAVMEGDVELRRRESYYRTLIERSSDLIMVLDQQGQIEFASASVKRILGWKSEHMVGRSALAFVHPDDMVRVEAEITELVLVHGRSAEIQYRVRTASGEWRVMDSVVTNLLRHPVVGAIVVNSRDVTARYEAEAALHAGESRLQRQNEALVEIAREQSRPGGSFEGSLRRITEIAATTLEVRRVGVWTFEPDRGTLQCLDRFDRCAGRHSSGYELSIAEAPEHFRALHDARTVSAEELVAAPGPGGAGAGAGQPGEVRSHLDAAIRVGGEVVGAVRFEYVGQPRRWTLDEQGFAGSIADMISAAIESSERRVAQELNRRLASIVEGSDDAIFSLSRHGRILSWNSGAERIYGYRPDEIVGRPVTRLLPADRASEEFQILARLERGDQVDHYETVHIRMDGRLVDISLTLSPIRDEGGRITSVGGIARDISSWRQAQQALIQARDAAETASRTKSHFLSSMSHELRTPLNSVIGFANVLRRNRNGGLLPQDIVYLDRILANGKHLLGLINDILDLSKIEAGRLEVELGEVDVAALVMETVGELQGSVQPGVAVVTNLPTGMEPVETDPTRLKQVLINLVGNALKFTDHGTVSVSVRTEVGTGRPVRIDVSDTGIGIPENRLSSIFQAFQQVDGGTARRFGGTGLGLAITASLCEILGHELAVDSTEGRGSTFSVLVGPRGAEVSPATSVDKLVIRAESGRSVA